MLNCHTIKTKVDVPFEAVEALLTRVIWQAVADLGAEAYRHEAEAFFGGGAFEEYCDMLGWNVRRARASLERFQGSGARISGNHLLPGGEGLREAAFAASH